VSGGSQKLTISDEERFRAAEEEVEKQFSDQDGALIVLISLSA